MGTTWARHLEVTSHTLTRDNIYICRKKEDKSGDLSLFLHGCLFARPDYYFPPV